MPFHGIHESVHPASCPSSTKNKRGWVDKDTPYGVCSHGHCSICENGPLSPRAPSLMILWHKGPQGRRGEQGG